jgi:hypothetical protein
MANAPVKDFIYLDVERIRSFVAQASGGLPSERRSESQHDIGGKASGKGKVPLLLEGEAEVDYHHFSVRSETKSLHDHLFYEFYAATLEKGKPPNVLRFPDQKCPTAWEEGQFSDGAFVIAKGVFRIMDYKFAAASIQSLPKNYETLVKLFATLKRSYGSKPTTPQEIAEEQRQQAERQKITDMVKNMPIKDLVNLTEQFYGDVVRVKVFPFEDSQDHLFVGTAHKELFRYTSMELTNWYGPIIDAGWSCVLQINKGVEHAPGEVTGPTGNAFDDKFETVLDIFTGLTAYLQRVRFPAVSVTPLAIYRDV